MGLGCVSGEEVTGVSVCVCVCACKPLSGCAQEGQAQGAGSEDKTPEHRPRGGAGGATGRGGVGAKNLSDSFPPQGLGILEIPSVRTW